MPGRAVTRRHVNGLTSQYTQKLCVAVVYGTTLNGRTRRAWTVGVLTPGASLRIDVVGRGSIDGRAQGGAAGWARAAEVRGSRGAGKQRCGEAGGWLHRSSTARNALFHERPDLKGRKPTCEVSQLPRYLTASRTSSAAEISAAMRRLEAEHEFTHFGCRHACSCVSRL